MNQEFETLVEAWMKRGSFPALTFLVLDDGSYASFGIHAAAIIEAMKRLGFTAIRGYYLMRCNDRELLLQLATDTDALYESFLNGDSN
jgi:hypothetical protein